MCLLCYYCTTFSKNSPFLVGQIDKSWIQVSLLFLYEIKKVFIDRTRIFWDLRFLGWQFLKNESRISRNSVITHVFSNAYFMHILSRHHNLKIYLSSHLESVTTTITSQLIWIWNESEIFVCTQKRILETSTMDSFQSKWNFNEIDSKMKTKNHVWLTLPSRQCTGHKSCSIHIWGYEHLRSH